MTDTGDNPRPHVPSPAKWSAAPQGTDWFWTELARLADRWNALEHPFYVRWSAGSLSGPDLVRYAEERDHLLAGLAKLTMAAATKAPEGILRDLLTDRAEREERYLELWWRFAAHTGWDRRDAWHYGDDANRETTVCAEAWAGGRGQSLAKDLVALCAVEMALPELAALEFHGLVTRYGFGHGPETAYFRERAGHVDDQGLTEAALAGLLVTDDPFALLSHAEIVHRRHWEMLDGIQRSSIT